MNSTQWETLTEFVKWLGREGRVKFDGIDGVRSREIVVCIFNMIWLFQG